MHSQWKSMEQLKCSNLVNSNSYHKKMCDQQKIDKSQHAQCDRGLTCIEPGTFI